MSWVESLAGELALALGNGSLWLSVAEAIAFGTVALLIGTAVARSVGALRSDAPIGETVGVGLSSGLIVVAVYWSTVASAGRSAFTPVAVSFTIALVLAVVRRRQATGSDEDGRSTTHPGSTDRAVPVGPWIVAGFAGVVFLAGAALLFGSTVSLSARSGVQPLEFMDEAFYSILGRDLNSTGAETFFSPSGFQAIAGLPAQTWYHWGELWLAAANIRVFGADPIAARHYIVLPLLLLASACVTGTLVRRLTGSSGRTPFLFGFFACLFLAPIPWLGGPYFSSWAVGLAFGITLYGLGAVAVLVAMFAGRLIADGEGGWPLVGFVGSVVAVIAPAHLILAVLTAVGVGGVCVVRSGQALLGHRRSPRPSQAWVRVLGWTCVVSVSVLGWGLVSGHGIGASGLAPEVPSFNQAWWISVATTVALGGAFLAIGVMAYIGRRSPTFVSDLYLGTLILLLVGAVVWGARLGDHNMFHAYFAGIAVFATPVAVVACWALWLRLRATGKPLAAMVVILLCVLQITFSAGLTIVRLQRFGPRDYEPVPLALLDAIQGLPEDAAIAYACQPAEEIAFWDARLLAITAHTGRGVVPMCFESEFLGMLVDVPMSTDVMSPLFTLAPQRALYPTASARPSPDQVIAFLEEHGIHYIYADLSHPNTLVPTARPVAVAGDFQVLALP